MNTVIVWKLFKLRRNGTLGPLFINARAVVPVGEWMEAEAHPTKGFAYRPGWHACFTPKAPHLSETPKSGPRRVWARCEAQEITTYDRPESQGGAWVLAKRLRVLQVFPNGLPQDRCPECDYELDDETINCPACGAPTVTRGETA